MHMSDGVWAPRASDNCHSLRLFAAECVINVCESSFDLKLTESGYPGYSGGSLF